VESVYFCISPCRPTLRCVLNFRIADMQGGSIELGANLWRGWGNRRRCYRHLHRFYRNQRPAAVADHNDLRSAISMARCPAPLALRPGLIGEANGFHSIFPATAGSQPDANGSAAQVGGGIDYRLSDRFAFRVLDAAWPRTQLSNSTDNVENNLRLGAGVVLCFAH
jgi:hypothetical protein